MIMIMKMIYLKIYIQTFIMQTVLQRVLVHRQNYENISAKHVLAFLECIFLTLKQVYINTEYRNRTLRCGINFFAVNLSVISSPRPSVMTTPAMPGSGTFLMTVIFSCSPPRGGEFFFFLFTIFSISIILPFRKVFWFFFSNLKIRIRGKEYVR